MKKISALLTLTKILERTKSKIELKKHRPRIIEINVIQSKSLPKFLLQDALRKFEVAFDIKMILSPRIVWTTSQDPVVEL